MLGLDPDSAPKSLRSMNPTRATGVKPVDVTSARSTFRQAWIRHRRVLRSQNLQQLGDPVEWCGCSNRYEFAEHVLGTLRCNFAPGRKATHIFPVSLKSNTPTRSNIQLLSFDVVSMNFNADFNSSATICEWLDDGTSPEDLQIETRRPWAKTYRLTRDGCSRFLKDLPPIQAQAISAMPLLSARFPKIVPQTVAVDETRGLILLEDHGGTDMECRPGLERKQLILETYAGLQAEAAECDDLVSTLPRIDLGTLVPQLLTFLDPKGTRPAAFGPALAKDYFDEDRCSYYFELFGARAAQLAALIGAADQLPVTINHCDLPAGNAAVRQNGELIIYDWDEAVAGPAGMSLHNFFSGCAIPCEMLLYPSTSKGSQRDDYRKLIGSYLRTLATNRYCSPAALNEGIPGAVCAGVIQYLLNYARFLPQDASDRDDIADIMRSRLNDLLDLGDLLQTDSRDQTLTLSDDYWKHDRGDRACQLLSMYTQRHPDDLDMSLRYAEFLRRDGDSDEANSVYRQQLELYPEKASVHHSYGLFLLDELEFEAAVEQLSVALELGGSQADLSPALDEASELLEVCRRAEIPDDIPTIRISEDERAHGEMNTRRKRLAVRLFRKYGTLLIEGAFPVNLVQELHETYLSRYQRYFTNEKKTDALKVGSKRYMITVDIDGPFNSPQVYANPFIEPIIQEVLGPSMIMGGFNSVCSLPESQHMRIHKDHPALFPESRDPDSLPGFAVTAVVAMRGFNADAGTTRVYKGSHDVSSRKVRQMDHQDPDGPQGSCLLMDYRLSHQGRANRSDEIRPILTMIYHRPWFRDIVNYGMQDPLRMSDEAYQQVPEVHRHLFDWARDTTSQA